MALYELSDIQVKNIRELLGRATIKGSEAITLLQILQSLAVPVKQETKKVKK